MTKLNEEQLQTIQDLFVDSPELSKDQLEKRFDQFQKWIFEIWEKNQTNSIGIPLEIPAELHNLSLEELFTRIQSQYPEEFSGSYLQSFLEMADEDRLTYAIKIFLADSIVFSLYQDNLTRFEVILKGLERPFSTLTIDQKNFRILQEITVSAL